MDAYLESLVKKGNNADVEPSPEVSDDSVDNIVEVVEDIAEDSVEVEVVLDKSDEPADAEIEVVDYKPGEVIYVKSIKVYKIPDTRQIARSITGNITFLGRVDTFAIINYMRHGFGLVKGYTTDL